LSVKRSVSFVNPSVMEGWSVKSERLRFSYSTGGVSENSPSPTKTAPVTRPSTGGRK
jgi:hypothetical protein